MIATNLRASVGEMRAGRRLRVCGVFAPILYDKTGDNAREIPRAPENLAGQGSVGY